jgi:hypothetical protein
MTGETENDKIYSVRVQGPKSGPIKERSESLCV